MRNLILWIFSLTLVPWLAFGQASHWDATMIAAQKAYGQAQFPEAEGQFLQAVEHLSKLAGAARPRRPWRG